MLPSYIVRNARIVSPGFPLDRTGSVLVEDGLIARIEEETHPSSSVAAPASSASAAPAAAAAASATAAVSAAALPVIDARSQILGPGLIDMHIHGCAGADSSSPDQGKALRAMAAYLRSHGVTTFQLASYADPEALSRIERAVQKAPDLLSSLCGVYLEGPFVNPEARGGLPSGSLRPCGDLAFLRALLGFRLGGRNLVRTMTIAPELEGSEKIEEILHKEGVKVAYGHSKARHKALRRQKGLHLTHLYNAMVGLEHRDPGLAICPFLDGGTTFELICDTVHVDEDLLRLTLAHTGEDQGCVVSDGMRGMGRPEGPISYGGRDAYNDGRVCRYTDGTLIGSSLPISVSAAALYRKGFIDIRRFFALASTNPARVLGLADRGAIKVGLRADLVLFDDDLNVLGLPGWANQP